MNLHSNPIEEVLRYIQEAEEMKVPEPTAMALATVVGDQASVRIVLFKGLIRGGLSFYTNYRGAKAVAIEKNNRVASTFFWPTLSRQIRIEGRAIKLTRQESEAYFKTRPRLSQLGAWASDQSQEIPSYEYLEEKLKTVEERFQGKEIPCPEHWGGYHILPTKIEFWFGKEGRLHERFVFERQDDMSPWAKGKRLSP